MKLGKGVENGGGDSYFSWGLQGRPLQVGDL